MIVSKDYFDRLKARAEKAEAEVKRLDQYIMFCPEGHGIYVEKRHDYVQCPTCEVERLRALSQVAYSDNLEAEVERLRKQNDDLMSGDAGMQALLVEELRAEVERLQRSADAWREDARLRELNRADLEAEVERLREALKEILEYSEWESAPIARNALAGEKE